MEETFWAFLLISLLRWHIRPPYAGVYSSPDTLVGQFDQGRLTNKVDKVYGVCYATFLRLWEAKGMGCFLSKLRPVRVHVLLCS